MADQEQHSTFIMGGVVGAAQSVQTAYNDIISKGDKRLDGWFMMGSPMPTVLLCLSYVTIVKFFGPKFMEKREPYQLRKIIVFYNFLQVLASAYIFYEVAVSGWFADYDFTCQPVDYSDSPNSKRMIDVSYWYYMSKFGEFFDTMFFVLRKKNQNISLLHVLHHGIMPFSTWVGVRYTPNGHNTFSGLLNSFVHVFMYMYYMITAMGPRYQKYVWWKKYLTSLQMVQFICVILHDFQLCFRDCDYPRFFMWWNGSHAVMFFFLFFDFYAKAYRKRITKATTGAALSVTSKISPCFMPSSIDESSSKASSNVSDYSKGEIVGKERSIERLLNGHRKVENEARQRHGAL